MSQMRVLYLIRLPLYMCTVCVHRVVPCLASALSMGTTSPSPPCLPFVLVLSCPLSYTLTPALESCPPCGIQLAILLLLDMHLPVVSSLAPQDVQAMLDGAESILVEGAKRLALNVQLVRKPRSVGIVPQSATIYEVGHTSLTSQVS